MSPVALTPRRAAVAAQGGTGPSEGGQEVPDPSENTMHQHGLAAVSLAVVTLCTAVCSGCSSSTNTTEQAGSSPAATQSAMTSASASRSASAGAGGGTSVAVASVGKFDDVLTDPQGEESSAFGAKWYVVNPAGDKVEGD